MRDKCFKLAIWGLMICLFSGINAQDPQFSQFYNSSLYYNPATAGISPDLRLSSSYRNLWSGIPGDISSYFLSVDYQWAKKNVGIGFLMMNNNEGLHRLSTQRAELIYSYRIQSKYRLLQFGMTAFSINIRDFKKDGFIFTDQLDPIYGVIQQSSFVSDEVEPVIYPDWNAGMVYRQNFKDKKITPTIGISASHIFRPNISFLNNKIRLPVKYVVHSSVLTRFAINGKDVWDRKFVFLNPGFVYEHQDPFQTFTFGSGFDVYPIHFGTWFRTRNFLTDLHKFNSVIINVGVILPVMLNHNLLIDYTYDSTVSKLEFASGGAHEITLIYNISLPERKHPVDCGEFEWWRVGKGVKYYSKKK